jgi:pimeloyl-ACP methyl ester carboxylesterase
MAEPPATVVLVHGGWHGAWCWDKVVRLLDQAGVPAVAVDLPDPDGIPGDLLADAAAVRRTLDALDGPAVLCGHSYGGMVITEAGLHPAVVHLVYLAAFLASVGTTLRELLGANPDWLRLSLAASEDGLIRLDAPNIRRLYQDCDPADAEAAQTRLRPQRRRSSAQPLSAAAWQSIPSTYAVCREDWALDPAGQRSMAVQAGSELLEWPTGHSPFLCRPDLVGSLLIELARREWSASS